MTIALAGLLALGYLPAFVFVLRHLQARDALERDERARDARERDAVTCRHAQQVEQLVSQITAAQQARADEIAALLQRIQAPEIAVIQHQQDTATPDQSWPLSDEESAREAEARALAIEHIERMEREGVMAGG